MSNTKSNYFHPTKRNVNRKHIPNLSTSKAQSNKIHHVSSLLLFFNSTQQVDLFHKWSFRFVYNTHNYTYLIDYKWLMNISYDVSLYLINIITYKHALFFLVFLNANRRIFPPKNLRLTLRSYSNFGYISNNT